MACLLNGAYIMGIKKNPIKTLRGSCLNQLRLEKFRVATTLPRHDKWHRVRRMQSSQKGGCDLMAIKKVLFVGSKTLGLKCLKIMWKNSPESLTGILTFDDSKDFRSVLNEFKTFASETQLSLHIATSSKESERIMKELSPELCWVVGWYWMISPAALKTVPHGFIGLHNSLLPKYRGGAPLVWALINGEKEVGISLFSFGEGMDDGDVWGQAKVSVTENDDIAVVLSGIQVAAEQLTEDLYLPILKGDVTHQKQEASNATYGALRTADDGLIDWAKPARDIHNFIRAQAPPYPGAFSFINSQKVVMLKSVCTSEKWMGTPGQVLRTQKDSMSVICGDQGVLEIYYQAEHKIKSINDRFKGRPDA